VFVSSSIRRITIPASLELLGAACFCDCQELSDVRFEKDSQLRVIKKDVFSNTELVELKIPNSLRKIDGGAFLSKSLAHIEFSEGACDFRVVNSRIENVAGTTFIRYFGEMEEIAIQREVEVIGSSCFCTCDFLETITFAPESSLRAIEGFAFFGSGLKRIALPASVEAIGEWCFANCQRFEEIVFAPGINLSRIAAGTFSWTGLTRVMIPSSVVMIEKSSFEYCSSLISVEFASQSKLKRIDKAAFRGTRITTIALPAFVEVIGRACFADCRRLATVQFSAEAKIKKFEPLLFYASGLIKIEVPKSVERICNGSCKGCWMLQIVTFEADSKLSCIENCAFADCPHIFRIEFPPSVRHFARDVIALNAQRPVQPPDLDIASLEDLYKLIPFEMTGSFSPLPDSPDQ
jgi:hypothetical protein